MGSDGEPTTRLYTSRGIRKKKALLRQDLKAKPLPLPILSEPLPPPSSLISSLSASNGFNPRYRWHDPDQSIRIPLSTAIDGIDTTVSPKWYHYSASGKWYHYSASEYSSPAQQAQPFRNSIVCTKAGKEALSECPRPAEDQQRRLSNTASAILLSWFNDHLERPYPTKNEVGQLARASGATRYQIRNFFINQRRKVIQTARKEAHGQKPGFPKWYAAKDTGESKDIDV